MLRLLFTFCGQSTHMSLILAKIMIDSKHLSKAENK